MFRWVAGLAAIAIAAVIGGVYVNVTLDSEKGVPGDPSDLTQVVAGKTVYDAHCAACHGASLEGQPNWRKPLPEGGLPAPPHDVTGHTWHHDDALLFNYTKKGGKAMVPSGFKSNMPGFADTLSDGEIWAVLAFIKSKWPEEVRERQATLNKR